MGTLPHTFEDVAVLDETGVFDGKTLGLSDDVHAPMHPTTFDVCELGGKRVAVFLVQAAPSDELRVAIVAAKPPWIDAIVFAEVAASPETEIAAIDATTDTAGTALLGTCAVAAAVTAEAHGTFEIRPASYRVRFASTIAVIEMAFDWHSETWSGTIRMRSADEDQE